MSLRVNILKNVYKKLDAMPLSFGIPMYSDTITADDMESYFGIELDDTLRELKMKSTDKIEVMSLAEKQIEDRTVYYALCKYRLSSSVYFKFTTATDGKSVDKSMIPKMISGIIADYDKRFKDWRYSSTATGTWNRGE